MHTIKPSITGRCILALYKIRLWLFLLVIWAWLSLAIICELRMREEGLRNRMSIVADLLTQETLVDGIKLDEILGRYGASFQKTEAAEEQENRNLLLKHLEEWHKLHTDHTPWKNLHELSRFLSPETNRLPGTAPVVVRTNDPKGDYANYQIDMRVSDHVYRTKKEFIDDARLFINARIRWQAKSPETKWFMSDKKWYLPGGFVRFYDYKRDYLNRMILGGLVTSLAIFGLLTSSGLGGFNSPAWRLIFGKSKIYLSSEGSKQSPFNRNITILQSSNLWLWGTFATILLIQHRQVGERKELWAEGWINHPVSFIILLFFGLALAVATRPRVETKGSEYFLDDYLNHYRQLNWCILCIPLSALIVIYFSAAILMPTDPRRAWIQIFVSVVVFGLSIWRLIKTARHANTIKCRESKDDPVSQQIFLSNYMPLIFLPKMDHTLPWQLFTMVGSLLIFMAIGIN